MSSLESEAKSLVKLWDLIEEADQSLDYLLSQASKPSKTKNKKRKAS